MKSLITVVAWLLLFAAGLIVAAYNTEALMADSSSPDLRLALYCALAGGAGGFLYCLRGTYLNYSAKDKWDDTWLPWYFIRPIASIICGGISMVFLKAGLLLLEADDKTAATNFGFYAFAFIAGMNVDNFIKKLEDVASTTWGISKSRTSQGQENQNNTDHEAQNQKI